MTISFSIVILVYSFWSKYWLPILAWIDFKIATQTYKTVISHLTYLHEINLFITSFSLIAIL